MRITAVAFIGISGLIAGQLGGGDSIEQLIRKLGSASGAEREIAFKMLQERPSAASAVRDALRSEDPEVARRAAFLLDHYDGRPVRELDNAIKNGDVLRAGHLMAMWPAGKNENEVDVAIRQLARLLDDLNKKKNADVKTKLDLSWLYESPPADVIAATRITEKTKAKLTKHNLFLRAKDVDVDYSRQQAETKSDIRSVRLIVAAGNVYFGGGGDSFVVIAGGNVRIGTVFDTLIVSGGDVTLEGGVGDSLIIAKGKITCESDVVRSRIMSTKTVSFSAKLTRDSSVIQNDPNPLGFVRFTQVGVGPK